MQPINTNIGYESDDSLSKSTGRPRSPPKSVSRLRSESRLKLLEKARLKRDPSTPSNSNFNRTLESASSPIHSDTDEYRRSFDNQRTPNFQYNNVNYDSLNNTLNSIPENRDVKDITQIFNSNNIKQLQLQPQGRDQEVETYEDILSLVSAQKLFPLHLLRKSYSDETSVQPLLSISLSLLQSSSFCSCCQSDSDLNPSSASASASSYKLPNVLCFSCCGTIKQVVSEEQVINSLIADIESGDLYEYATYKNKRIGLSESVDRPLSQSLEKLQLQAEVLRNASQKIDGNYIPKPAIDINVLQMLHQSNLNRSSNRAKNFTHIDGLYSYGKPLLAPLIFYGENPSKSVSQYFNASNSLKISRITCRTLRNMQRSVYRNLIRTEIRRLKNADMDQGQSHPHEGVSEIHFLRVINNFGMCFNVIENPVRYLLIQPHSIADVSASGLTSGRPGLHKEFDYDSQTAEGPVGDKKRRNHIKPDSLTVKNNSNKKKDKKILKFEESIQNKFCLKVYLDKMSIYKHHYLSDEQTLLSRFQIIYNDYTTIVQNRSLGYLAYKVYTLSYDIKNLLSKLMHYVDNRGTNGSAPLGNMQQQSQQPMTDFDIIDANSAISDEVEYNESVTKLQYLFFNFAIHVKQLRDLREYFEESVTMLIEIWREILSVRDKTKVVSTRANIVIKNVKHPVYAVPTGGELIDDSDGGNYVNERVEVAALMDEQAESWKTLCRYLKKTKASPQFRRLPQFLQTESQRADSALSLGPAGSGAAGVSQIKSSLDQTEAVVMDTLEKSVAELDRVVEEGIKAMSLFKSFSPDYAVKLVYDMDITPDTNITNNNELARRKVYNNVSYKAKLRFSEPSNSTGRVKNGVVTSSPWLSATRDNNMNVEFNYLFEFFLSALPLTGSVYVDIYTKSLTPKSGSSVVSALLPFQDSIEIYVTTIKVPLAATGDMPSGGSRGLDTMYPACTFSTHSESYYFNTFPASSAAMTTGTQEIGSSGMDNAPSNASLFSSLFHSKQKLKLFSELEGVFSCSTEFAISNKEHTHPPGSSSQPKPSGGRRLTDEELSGLSMSDDLAFIRQANLPMNSTAFLQQRQQKLFDPSVENISFPDLARKHYSYDNILLKQYIDTILLPTTNKHKEHVPSNGDDGGPTTATSVEQAEGSSEEENKILMLLKHIDIHDPLNSLLISQLTSRLKSQSRRVFRLLPMSATYQPYTPNPDYAANKELADSNLGIAYQRDGLSGEFSPISYEHFVAYKLPARMELYLIRSMKPFMFSQLPGIPLNSRAIVSEPMFKAILDQHSYFNMIIAANKKSDGGVAGKSFKKWNSLTAEEEAVETMNIDDSNQVKIASFMQRVKNNQLTLSKHLNKRKMTTSTFVAETDYFGSSDAPEAEPLDLGSFFQRKRALKPKGNQKGLTALSHRTKLDFCNVLVQVIGAKNIPLRVAYGGNFNATTNSTAAPDVPPTPQQLQNTVGTFNQTMLSLNQQQATASNDLIDIRELMAIQHILDTNKLNEMSRARTVVEVKFQKNGFMTNPVGGSNPLWKQSVSLPLSMDIITNIPSVDGKPPQQVVKKVSFTPHNLMLVRDVVTFSLFNEVIVDDQHRGGFLEGESSERTDKNYLGHIEIPFITVFQATRIEGLFRLDTPIFYFGYEESTSIEDDKGVLSPQSQYMDRVNANPNAANCCGLSRPFSFLDVFSWLELIYVVFSTLFNYCVCILSCDCFAYYNRNRDARAARSDPKNINSNFSELSYAPIVHPDTEKEFSHFISSNTSKYLKVMLTVEPLNLKLIKSDDRQENITLNVVHPDDKPLFPYIQEWLLQLKRQNLSLPSTNTGGPKIVDENGKPISKTKKVQRDYICFVTNQQGYSVFISRYLCAMKPPNGFNTRRSIIHFVTQIPFIPDAQSFGDGDDIDLWCTMKQTFALGAGDEEESAVMLFNYLYYLDKVGGNKDVLISARTSTVESISESETDATIVNIPYDANDPDPTNGLYLVVGEAFPEGKTVYILMRDTRKSNKKNDGLAPCYLIIHPTTGHIYGASNPDCPLHTIHNLVTPYNVYANIQSRGLKPCDLNYDVTLPDKWSPFFTIQGKPASSFRKFKISYPVPNGLTTFQEQFKYKSTDEKYALEIERSLKTAIKTSMRKWRSKRFRSLTSFHPDSSVIMTECLVLFENWKKNGRCSANDAVSNASSVAAGNESPQGKKPPLASSESFLNKQSLDSPSKLRRIRATAGAPSQNFNIGSGAGAANFDITNIMQLQQEIVQKRLKSILKTRKLHGFPLNIPYSDTEAIVNKIKSLKIHENLHPDVQFVLAVRAFPLVNGIVSLWIFIGTLETI